MLLLVQAILEAQRSRDLSPEECACSHVFLRQDGSRVTLDGLGQAWEIGASASS